jgi:hypothetical protein
MIEVVCDEHGNGGGDKYCGDNELQLSLTFLAPESQHELTQLKQHAE